MTYGGSLKIWEQAKILDRELAIYHEHAEVGWQIDLMSFGNTPDEARIADRYSYINVYYNSFKLHPRLYSWALPLLHSKPLRIADVYKTNQMYGTHIANYCAFLWKKPVVVRQGYGHFDNRSKEQGSESSIAKRAFRYEHRNLRKAEFSIFTTEELAKSSIKRHDLFPEKTSVVPNYIVPEIWSPPYIPREKSKKIKLIYFGRFSEEKNLISLLEAIRDLPVEIHLVGEGPLKQTLKDFSLLNGISCIVSPQMPQMELRNALAEADAFVLPSLYEGHPKALIEALAYGIPVLATDSPGIREVIEGHDFAISAETSSKGLKQGVKKLLALSLDQRVEMGRQGREWAMTQFSVHNVADKERTILEHATDNY